MAEKPILVLGATGRQGGAVTAALLARRAAAQVDVPALHAAHPEVGWTSFADWAGSQPWSS